MQIEKLEIKNYRGLNIKIDTIEKVAIMIGQNDSGKTNVCSAILKVLDYNFRRKPFIITDSTSCNMEPIEITITLSLDNLTVDQLAIIREYIHEKENRKYTVIKILSDFNSDILQYEDRLFIGDPTQDFIELKADHQCALDKILSVVYINPKYDNNNDKKEFFKHKETDYISNTEEGRKFSANIEKTIEELNDNIQNEEALKQILEDISDFGSFNSIFEDIDMKLSPNIKLNNLFNSLDILYYDKDGEEINNIGDGKSKILSMLLKSKIYDEEKQKIYIVEEPENHLYVLLQRFYIESLLAMEPSQLLITTHSPYTVDFEKTKQIIKVGYNTKNYNREIYLFNIDNEDFKRFGYLINIEVAEMLYYNTVLLVEGSSEKYFYNLLLMKDNTFRNYIIDNKIGIFSVNGVAFKTIRELLQKLGINVIIKTDNDIFKVQRTDNTYRYAGLKRCIDYLSLQEKSELNEILQFEDINDASNYKFEGKGTLIQNIEEKKEHISRKLKEYNILLATHHDGFEKDFLDYIGYAGEEYEKAFDDLNKSKLINLHDFIIENSIDISIKDNNKNSILVSFYGD